MSARRAVGPLSLDSLGTRLAALLTLAILPLGLIVILQTYRVLDEAEQKTDAALLGQTLRAARPERGAIQEALGAATGLGVAVDRLQGDPAACSAFLAEFVARDPDIRFAGFVPSSRRMTCASEGAPIDLSGSQALDQAVREPDVSVQVTESGRVTGLPAIVVRAPVLTDEGEMQGFVLLSLALERIRLPEQTPDAESGVVPRDVLTFNAEGEILTSSAGLTAVERRLPVNRSLRAFVGGGPAVFRDVNAVSEPLIYTVTPLVENAVYAMAVWPSTAGIGEGGLWRWTVPTLVLPFLMWATSLAVAFLAVHRLVIRHVARLRKRMRLFSRFRRVEEDPADATLPTELREVTESFVNMAYTIIRDEAEQEDLLREKDALLREVYHRVRNNLQLVASINNMQIRASRSAEAKHVLRRLQDRIMALATIHGSLYDAGALSKVRVDPMIEELTTQIAAKAKDVDPGLEIRTQTVPVMLHPDQAVPLALLAVEALTNAVKHLGRPQEGPVPYVAVTLDEEEEGPIMLRVENSVGTEDVVDFAARGHEGLGLQLVEAFTVQLGGEKHVRLADEIYCLTVRFHAIDYGDEAAIA